MTTATRPAATDLAPLRNFVAAIGALIDRADDEAGIFDAGRPLLRTLVAYDSWLPHRYAVPDPERYTQYLLHRDPRARFSVVSFVWGPGQATPIHDHRVWGLVGVLRGAERVESFDRDDRGALVADAAAVTLSAGEVDAVGPSIGDYHRVANAFDDRTSVSIHVYGGDIGRIRRATYDLAGREKPFISGYADAPILDLGLAA